MLTKFQPFVVMAAGDKETFGSIKPGYVLDVEIDIISGQPGGVYDVYALIDRTCVVSEASRANNLFGPQVVIISSFLFEDISNLMTCCLDPLQRWQRFLYPCAQAAMNGTYGACVERGDNDKRKQLIDDTPAYETAFNARFNFDINSLSMTTGETLPLHAVQNGCPPARVYRVEV